MLGSIVAADGAFSKGLGKSLRVGGVEEVGDVEGRGVEAVEDTD